MIDDPDFNLDAENFDIGRLDASKGQEESPDADAPHPAEPVVVIQYRNRGLPAVVLFPLTLVASLALFAGYHHLYVQPIFSRTQALAASQAETLPPAAPDLDETLAQVSAAMAPHIPMPLTLESQPLPPGFLLSPPVAASPRPVEPAAPLAPDVLAWPGSGPPPLKTAEPAPPAETKPSDPPTEAEEPRPAPPISIASTASDAVKPVPPQPEASTPEVDELPEPAPPTREELMERIRQEGLLKQAHEDEMERRKLDARVEVAADAQARVENDRDEFRRALGQIVAAGGRDAGEAIEDLCNQFGRGYSEELKNRAYGSLAHYKGKLTRDGEVQMLRAIGVPEPGILDYLANRLHRSMNSRNGPRGPAEVRLFAAKQLLRIRPDSAALPAAPPPSSTPAQTKPTSVRRTINARRP
ncbi:hypothetical protein [Planctomyces sp. SH-PL62]|uniref:hypothetical protein n=1 Tax=Planctomyces sp. SH-PL62 TaxID=1636152 RepID=UPI00078E6374|nr:hypothetical protein [Planctomyces sp. SH-PL62]AMV39457.1 hypothetical protein VT85_18610 [Planctomyces sp. SH-PL62]